MDERRRDRERAAAQGDHAAAVEVLRHRLRAGEVTEERLALLVFLGDEVAAAALGRAVEPWPTNPHDRRSTAEYLHQWGAECLGRVAAALARAAATLSDDGRVRAAAEAVDDWVLCPCDAHVGLPRATGVHRLAREPNLENIERRAAECAAEVARGVSKQESVWILERGRTQKRLDERMATSLAHGMEALHLAGLDPVAVVLSETRPWALGTGDPVRERVSGRKVS